MAKRKQDIAMNSSLYNPGVQSTDQYTVVQQEKNVLTGILEGQYQEKNSNLNKFSGARTEIVYFHQKVNNEDNGALNTSGFNATDPNLSSFIKIEKFVAVVGDISNSFDESEGNGPKSVLFEGKMVVLPNTIQPSPRDYFTMKYLDRTVLFQVYEVNPLSADDDSAYDVSFQSKEPDFTYEGSELSKQVTDEYVMDETYIGLNVRTVFRKTEYETLQNLKSFYSHLGEIYKDHFWNKELETFEFTYENNLDQNSLGDGSMMSGNSFCCKKCIVLGKDFEVDGKLSAEKFSSDDENAYDFEFNENYKGRVMYDSALIEFIIRNRIFENIENFPLIPTQYGTNVSPLAYKNSIFYSLEERKRKRFVNRYILPIELNIATPGSQPVLYGTLSLMHVSAPSELTLTLLPEDLYDLVHHQSSEVLPCSEFSKENVFVLMEYIISLYINKLDKNILELFSEILKRLNEVDDFDIELIQYQAFYILPIIGFIAKELANRIVDRVPDYEFISDPVERPE